MLLDQQDSAGRSADKTLIGTRWRHFRNKNVYKIIAFSWCGETDLWNVIFKRPGEDALFNRSLDNFGSAVTLEDGTQGYRFTEEKE
jgi:hypothetical protein